MTSFALYEHDLPNVSVNAGFVGASEMGLDPACTSFMIKHNNNTIAFNKQTSPHIGDGDLVMNSWALNFLNVEPAHTVLIEPVVISQTACVVELTFVAYQSQVNWDELPHTGPLRIPYMWSSSWPDSYNRSVLERNAPILLHGSVLHDGSLVCMKVLDSLMVFRVGLSTASATSSTPTAILASPECTYRIVVAAPTKPAPTQTAATFTSSSSLSKTPLCFEPTVRNVMYLCNGVFGTDARPGSFVKGVLLSAPAGGGKSVLLDSVASICADTHEGVTVLRASCKGLDQRQDSLASSVTDAIDAIDTSEWGLLLQVLRFLGMEHLVSKQQSTQTGSILLCLDDIDAVFMHYSARKDDNLETGRSAEIYQQFGYQLSQLLHILASPSNTTRILVIGCTRKDPTQLLRAHTGCPEFEKCFALCSPNFTERVLILNKLLTDANLVYQANPDVPMDSTLMTTTADVQRAVRSDWATRLAALSAGYLPGDLAAVTQRIVFLHRGKVVVSKSMITDSVVKKESEEKTTDVVLWSTPLDAIVSVIPLTLQQLGVRGNSARKKDRE